jgi:two-component system response regulator YesN
MLKVLLVDDDIIIRTTLMSMIDWEQCGFMVAGEVNNGVECIQRMSTDRFDLIITDMNMPIMDGIALIESICKYYPEIEVIVISGHDNYDYVRTSLKKGAIDYILKQNLNKEILCEVLEIVKYKIKEKNKLLYHNKFQLEQLSKGRSFMLYFLVHDILSGNISCKETKLELEKMGTPFLFINFVLCYIEVKNFPDLRLRKKDQVIKSYIDLVKRIIMEDGHGLVTNLEDGYFIAFIDFEKVKSGLLVYQKLTGILSRINTNSEKYMGLHTSIAVSDLCGNYDKIPELFQKIRKSLENKFYEEQQIVWQHDEMLKVESQMSLSIYEKEDILRLLEVRDKEGILHTLDDLFDECRKKNVSVSSVKEIVVELIRIAIQFCMKHGLGVMRDELEKTLLLDDYVNKNFRGLCKLVIQTYEKVLLEFTNLQEERGNNPHVIKAMKYINAHYRTRVSLTDTAEYVGVNAQYLSRLIKEEYKKGFAEILNEMRVEIACEMIRSHNYKVKEIVEKAGFSNYNYFFKVFKDVTGLTPIEYERQQVYKQSLERY